MWRNFFEYFWCLFCILVSFSCTGHYLHNAISKQVLALVPNKKLQFFTLNRGELLGICDLRNFFIRRQEEFWSIHKAPYSIFFFTMCQWSRFGDLNPGPTHYK